VVGSITCLNVHPVAWDPSTAPDHRITTILGDGCHLDFADKSFDIVFSNSVIEHVGSNQKQKAFASECLRVGKAIWIQTPAFECPIEPHYLAPFVHWLPTSVQRRILRHFTPWGLIQKPTSADIDEVVSTTRLLTRHEFTSMMHNCSIYSEKIMGFLPKSYTAYRKENASPLSSAKSPMATSESGMLPNLK
jgi:ubiquinone/menaquinone biosynthesis C-methylase UbiE